MIYKLRLSRNRVEHLCSVLFFFDLLAFGRHVVIVAVFSHFEQTKLNFSLTILKNKSTGKVIKGLQKNLTKVN